jgi:hypothetical protein
MVVDMEVWKEKSKFQRWSAGEGACREQSKMNKLKQAIKNFVVRVRHTFTKGEAFVKTASVTVLGGGVTSVADAAKAAHAAGHFAINMENLLALKASFITGAAIAFVGYLSQFPAFAKNEQPKN